MTAQEVITLARRMLFDEDATDGNRQWPDATLLAYVSEAQRDLLRVRPDLLLAADQTLTTITDPALTSSNLLVDATYRLALAESVAQMALSEDNADKANQSKAADFKQRAETRMHVA